MTEVLHLELLGGLRVSHNGAPVACFISRKAPALLCYLAVIGRPQFRSVLAALLWGDLPESDAAANLRQVLTNLRRLLGPYLLITRQTVAFDRQRPYELDVERFEALLDAGMRAHAPEQIRAAVTLYCGDFLQGFVVRDAPEFEEWAMVEQERLHERAVEALRLLAAQMVARGELADGIVALRRLLVLDPWREEAHRQLMLLYARTGQLSVALAQYAACRRILAAEVGVEPAEETTALCRRITAARTARRRPLVTPPTSFVGRAGELADLRTWLADPGCRLVTIVGPGGIGKTRLALEAARQLDSRFLEGVCVVPLSGARPGTVLAATIAVALDLPSGGGLDLPTRLLRYLQERELLLVLDNFEHLIGSGTDLLAEILQHAPDIKLLVTSRERLQLQAERLLELEGLTVPRGPAVSGFEDYGAIRLFVERARLLDAHWSLSQADRPHALRICRLLGGLPLGIELATAWVRVLSCAELAREIERGVDLLAAARQDLPERQRSLRAVFDHSWNLLGDAERGVFRDLAVFQGGFGREAAEQIAGASLDSLLALVDKSLLRREPSGRYDMHEAVHQYATARLREAADAAARARQRHADYYAAVLRKHETLLRSEKSKATTETIGAECDNLWAAWQWAVEHGQQATAELALNSLRLVYEVRGRFEEGEAAFARAAAGLRNGLDRTDGRGDEHLRLLCIALGRQGLLCIRLGLNDRAQTLLLESHALGRRLGVAEEADFSGSNLGNVALQRGQYHEARQFYQESLRIKRERGDTITIGVPFNNLGYVAYLLGDYEEAQQLLDHSLACCDACGDRWGRSFALTNLGATSAALGDYARARQLLEESLVICRELGDQLGSAEALLRLGDVAATLEQPGEARGLLNESLAIARACGDRAAIAAALACLSAVARALGAIDDARDCGVAALETATRMPSVPLALQALAQIGACCGQDGETARAAALLGIVVRHPATDHQTRVAAERLCVQLASPDAAPGLPAVVQQRYPDTLDEAVRVLLHARSRSSPAHDDW